MKPFDLQKALAGEPVVFGNGRKCLEIKQFKNGVVVSLDEFNVLRKHNSYGELLSYSTTEITHHSLFMAEKPKIKKEGWIAICTIQDHKLSAFVSNAHKTKDALESMKYSGVLSIQKIEWEEEE